MLRKPRFWFTLLSIWFVVLFFLSNAAHLTPPGPEFDHRDKVYHAVYYSLGGAWFFVGLRLFNLSRNLWKATLLTVLFCSAVGVFDEWHQSFIPNRSGNDFGDWSADTFGGVLGAALGTLTLVVLRLLPSKAQTS